MGWFFCQLHTLDLTGGKSLAEGFLTGARCALSGLCPSAAVEGQFGLLHLHEAGGRGEGAIKTPLYLAYLAY